MDCGRDGEAKTILSLFLSDCLIIATETKPEQVNVLYMEGNITIEERVFFSFVCVIVSKCLYLFAQARGGDRSVSAVFLNNTKRYF